jgi:hypothetical protein
MIQEVAACYALGVQGWAQLMPDPPRLADAQGDDQAAWECYGAIIFWMHRPGLGLAEYKDEAKPYWRRLETGLLPAATDPLYWFMHSSLVPLEAESPLTARLLHAFPDELRPILEWGLQHQDELTSIFPRYISQDRGKYIISMLEVVGNAETAELLRPYVDDPSLGSSAIAAIKTLTGRQS